MNWQRIKRLASADGQLRANIETTTFGHFRFSEDSYLTEEGHSFWTPTWESGLYGSAEDAERAARAEIPWLKKKIQTETPPDCGH